MTPQEFAMIDAINTRRRLNGLHDLRPVERLAEAARPHSEDMALHPGLVHEGSDGSTIGGRILSAGYDWRGGGWFGEVVGWGWGGSVQMMVAWWMASPAHRPYVLGERFTDIGVGYVVAPGSQWGYYWTVDFGASVYDYPTAERPVPPPEPSPHVVHVPIVMGGQGATIDLVPYLCGDGRAYRVANGRGSFEVFQSQREGNKFYQLKAWDDLSVVNYEEFVLTDDYICRDVDTSPGGGRYYRQFGAPWVKRRMRVGETTTQTKRVQFFFTSDCTPSAANSGTVQDSIQLVAHHRALTLRTGVELEDVVQLRWVDGGEDYYYARGYGLVQWGRAHNDPNSPAWSALCEMKPGLGTLRRLEIPCLRS